MRKSKVKWLIVGLVTSFVIMMSFTGLTFAKQTVTIKMAQIFDPAAGAYARQNYEWYQGVIKDFEKVYPNIKVKLEWFKWDEIDVKSMMHYRTGIPHDVLLSSPQYMPKHALVGDFLDLSSFVKKEWTKEKQEDFNWSPVWKKCFPLGIPMGVHTRTIVYRKDMFAAVGIYKTPENVDELLEDARKLTRDTNGDGIPDIWGLGMYLGASRATIELYFAPYIWHFGGKLWDPITKKATFASEQGVKSAKFLNDLVYEYKVTPKWAVSGTYDDVILHSFLNGKLGMADGFGSYWIGALENKGWVKGIFPATPQGKSILAGVFPIPTKPHAQFTNAWTLSIHKLSKHPAEAFKFLSFLAQPKYLYTYPDAGLPACLTDWKRPAYSTPFYKEWLFAAKHGRAMPPTAHYGELSDAVAAAIGDIVVKKSPIKATLKKAQDEYNASYAGE
ncbi:extracellular solute-binding protein [Candidatus Aerophobetes bacterium]|nr:extracellular solute-binding protein [Candidatus Aerophobetes bacterium]